MDSIRLKTKGLQSKMYLTQCHHGLFTNGWETRSRDVWKPVSNRTPGIISKICKLGGGTPAPVCSRLLRPVGTLQDFAWFDMEKNDSSSIKRKCFLKSMRDASYILAKEGWPGY